MKSSKSSNIISVTQKIFLRHPRYDVSATLRSLSEQPFDFTMHYNRHRDLPPEHYSIILAISLRDTLGKFVLTITIP